MNRRRPRPSDAGMVTVEAAVALSAIILVLACCLAGIGCAAAQVACVDAAREAARQAARGDDAAATEAVRVIGPSGAELAVDRGDPGTVSVTVSVRPIGGLLPGVRVSATAVAALEPQVSQGSDRAD